MKLNKKTMIHAIFCSLNIFVVMMLFVSLNYIDFSVIRTIYVPIYAIAITTILFRQYIFGYIFITSAGLGLIIEYFTHLSQENPTMTGAFLNSLLIFLGFIIGIAVQIIITIVRRNREARPESD